MASSYLFSVTIKPKVSHLVKVQYNVVIDLSFLQSLFKSKQILFLGLFFILGTYFLISKNLGTSIFSKTFGSSVSPKVGHCKARHSLILMHFHPVIQCSCSFIYITYVIMFTELNKKSLGTW